MAIGKVISSLLVGIGFDVDKKSTDKVASSIDGIKSKALKLGAIVAGAFGIKALTSDFAAAKNDLGNFSDIIGVSASDVQAFGSAMRLERGSLEGFMAQLESIERFRAGILVGDLGFLVAAKKAGIDTQAMIKAKDALGAFMSLANKVRDASKQGRINIARAVGLDDASLHFLSKGFEAAEEEVRKARDRRLITPEMLRISKEYNQQLEKMKDNIGGFADKVSTAFLPGINSMVAGMNDWLEVNRQVINSDIDKFFDNLNTVVSGIGKVSRSLGESLFKLINFNGVPLLVPVGGATNDPTGKTSNISSGIPTLVGKTNREKDNRSSLEKRIDARRVNFERTQADLKTSDSIFKRNSSDKLKTEKLPPIVIHNNVNLDGKVIDKKIQKVVGGMADKAIRDLSSTEGG